MTSCCCLYGINDPRCCVHRRIDMAEGWASKEAKLVAKEVKTWPAWMRPRPITTEQQQETDDRQARAQILGDLDYQRSHEGLDTWNEGDE